MNQSIRVRGLTKQELEDKYFRKSEVGQRVTFSGRPMSIMGKADHAYVRQSNIDMKWDREYLGDGEYFYDGPARPAATGGRTAPVLWGTSDAYIYLNSAARELGIQIFGNGDILYFETEYADAFLDAFCYVDRTLHRVNENSFFISRFFGWGVPDWNSKASKAIQKETRNILAKVTRHQNNSV